VKLVVVVLKVVVLEVVVLEVVVLEVVVLVVVVLVVVVPGTSNVFMRRVKLGRVPTQNSFWPSGAPLIELNNGIIASVSSMKTTSRYPQNDVPADTYNETCVGRRAAVMVTALHCKAPVISPSRKMMISSVVPFGVLSGMWKTALISISNKRDTNCWPDMTTSRVYAGSSEVFVSPTVPVLVDVAVAEDKLPIAGIAKLRMLETSVLLPPIQNELLANGVPSKESMRIVVSPP